MCRTSGLRAMDTEGMVTVPKFLNVNYTSFASNLLSLSPYAFLLALIIWNFSE